MRRRELLLGAVGQATVHTYSTSFQDSTADSDQNSLSEVSKWQFTPTEGYDRADSFFCIPYATDETVYAGDIGGRMHALDTQTGEQRWEYSDQSLPLWTSPVEYEGTVYFGSGIDPDEHDGRIYAVDAENGEMEWEFSSFNGTPGPSALSAGDGSAYFFAREEESIYAVDSTTGDLQWTYEYANSSPTYYDGSVVFNNPGIVKIDSGTGDEIWSNNINSATYTTKWPVISDELIYSVTDEGDSHRLSVVDIDTGDEIRSFDGVSGSSQQVPLITDDNVFTTETNQTSTVIRSIDSATMDEQWKTEIDEMRSTTAILNGTIYVGTAEENLYTVDPVTGDLQQIGMSENAELRLSRTVSDQAVYIATTTGLLFAIDNNAVPSDRTNASDDDSSGGSTSESTSSSLTDSRTESTSGSTNASSVPIDPVAVFRQASGTTDSRLIQTAVALGSIGLGYGVFKTVRRKTTPQVSTNVQSASPDHNTEDNAIQSGFTDTDLESISYDNIDLGEVIKETDSYTLRNGLVDSSPIWMVIPPQLGNKTISALSYEQFIDTTKPWAGMDRHSNVLTVYGSSTEPHPWVCTERGDPAINENKRDQLTNQQVLGIVTQICDAIHHISRYGITYHGLSTNSVMIDRDNSITLYGVLDQFDDTAMWYAAPEESESGVTEDTLTYRIGLIAYELLTGSLPYHRYPNADPTEFIHNGPQLHEFENFEQLDADLQETLSRALSPSPADRHETVLHLRDELNQSS